MPLLPKEGFSAQLGQLPINGGRRADMEDPLAAATQGFAHQAAQQSDVVLKQMEEDEGRNAIVASSEIRAKYAKALDDAALNGGDLPKLKEQMQAELQKAGEGFQTKKGAQSLQIYTANASLMFDEQANHIAVQRAFANAKQGASKLLNSESAIIQGNPLYLSMAVQNAHAYIDTLSGIRPEQKAQLKDDLGKELNMSAALASARVDPTGTRKRLEAGEWDLNPHQRDMALSKAESEVRAARAEQAYLDAATEKKLHQDNDDAWDGHFKDIMKPDGNAATIRRDIMDDPRLRPQTREHLINVMTLRAKEMRGEGKASDPTVVRDLWLRIHAQENDPKRIYTNDAISAAVEKGSLNTTDADRLNAAVANQKDENNRSFGQKLAGRIQVVSNAVRNAPEYVGQPELQAAIVLEVMNRAEKQASVLRAEGKSPDAILDSESKDNFFKPGTLKSIGDDVRAQRRAAGDGLDGPGLGDTVTIDGKDWQYQGGDKGKPSSWREIKPRTDTDNYREWLQDTGGNMKPGQTQEQAIEAWKKARDVGAAGP
jgi:hypothetical protein